MATTSRSQSSVRPWTEAVRSVFGFPNPVNEVAVRMVAGMVVLLTLATIFSGQGWLYVLLAYGFLARVATGPTLSPMGLLATRVLAPRSGIQERLVPGPPKPLRPNRRTGLFDNGARALPGGGLDHRR